MKLGPFTFQWACFAWSWRSISSTRDAFNRSVICLRTDSSRSLRVTFTRAPERGTCWVATLTAHREREASGRVLVLRAIQRFDHGNLDGAFQGHADRRAPAKAGSEIQHRAPGVLAEASILEAIARGRAAV